MSPVFELIQCVTSDYVFSQEIIADAHYQNNINE